MPMVAVRGPSTGARMISAALMSMNMPTIRGSPRISPITTCGLREIDKNSLAIAWGICM